MKLGQRRARRGWLSVFFFGCLVVIGWAALPPSASGPVAASRLTIRFRAGTFSLLTSAALFKVIAPSDVLPAAPPPCSGFWYELQSPQGEVVYRRIMSDPTAAYTEVAGPEGGSGPERAEVVPEETTFSVLIPEVPGTNQLIFFSSPPGVVGKMQPATVVGRIPIVSPAR